MYKKPAYVDMTQKQKNGYINGVKKTIARKKAVIDSYKRERGCCVCRESDPIVLDFHHRDESSKSPVLKRRHCNRSVWVMGWAAMMEEMEKCDVICANCHRRLNYMQRNITEVV